MNVGKLKALLAKYPDDKLVVIPGYEGGYENAGEPETLALLLNVNTSWYYGPHDKPSLTSKGDDVTVDCVAILPGDRDDAK